MKNMAADIAQLATYLGYDTFNLVGEDWGDQLPTKLPLGIPTESSSSSSKR